MIFSLASWTRDSIDGRRVRLIGRAIAANKGVDIVLQIILETLGALAVLASVCAQIALLCKH